MTETLSAIELAWQNTSQLEIISVLFGLAYVLLAAQENSWCWPAAFIGTGTGILVFWDASLVMESGLNVYYLLMAIYGWWQWQHGGDASAQLEIRSWSFKQHLIPFFLIALLSAISGFLLKQFTGAALPFIDSLTTWSAVVATWMVANKVLQNWVYWIVIDTVSIWLFLQRGLALYALLFVLYTVIAIYGYFNWQKAFKANARLST